MELKIVKLKEDFNTITNIRDNVNNGFDALQLRIDKLKLFYSEFIKNNNNNIFVFGLDSFRFQSKIIDIEYEDMKRLFLAINNRMYCEYFKLHKILVEYISKNNDEKVYIDTSKVNIYPIYKDLEPFKEYNFEIIADIHENILNILSILMSVLNNKENELSIHKLKENIGLNINNFITTYNFNINVLKEKIHMFINYIEFFHKMHSKYLKRFSNKIQLMYTHINNDIKFDDSVEITNTKKQELITELTLNNIDKTLLKEIKSSICSETNNDSESETQNSLLNENVNENVNEKKNLNEIFKKNVYKVKNGLHLLKSKDTILFNREVSNHELEKMFYGIENSCDSIINYNNDKIEDKMEDKIEDKMEDKIEDKMEDQIEDKMEDKI